MASSPNIRLINNSTSADVNVLASAAYTSTQTSEWYPADGFTEVVVQTNVSAVTGTTPTLDVYLQTLLPDCALPCDLAAFTQITSAVDRVLNFSSGGNSEYLVTNATMTAGSSKAASLGKFVRVVAKIGGTNPSFTCEINLRART